INIYYDNYDAKDVKLANLRKYLRTIETNRIRSSVSYASDAFCTLYFKGVKIQFSDHGGYHIDIDKTKYEEIGIKDTKKLFDYLVDDEAIYHSKVPKLIDYGSYYRLEI
ncbi:MAG: hypothetical protein IJ809_02295, partial [Clostridia bacterium]|nr:hypothetical protein [Clostridia bacterium]